MKFLVELLSGLGLVIALGGVSTAQVTLKKLPTTTATLQKSVQSPEMKIAVSIAKIRDSRIHVTMRQADQLNDVALLLSEDKSDEAQSLWRNFVAESYNLGAAVDINAVIQWVLRESYLDQSQDLQFYADKVRFHNAIKESIRNELKRLRKRKAEITAFYEDEKSTMDNLGASMEARMELALNAEQEAQAKFISIAQKDPQLWQKIASTMKTLCEIRSEIALNESDLIASCVC